MNKSLLTILIFSAIITLMIIDIQLIGLFKEGDTTPKQTTEICMSLNIKNSDELPEIKLETKEI